MAIHSERVEITGEKGVFEGFSAAPEGAPVPRIIVISEIFGVNAHIREVTERVAAAGYAALAPGLFWQVAPGHELGYSPEDIQKALELMGRIDLDLAVKDVAASMELLGARPECSGSGLGITGFCWGGLISYLVSCRLEPACAVPYYGGRIAEFLGEVDNIGSPVLFHFGEKDPRIPPEQVEQVRDAVAGRADIEVHSYPGAEHGFNCDMRGSYHQANAQLAWRRTMDFFAKHLA